jgi:hypothetical protein
MNNGNKVPKCTFPAGHRHKTAVKKNMNPIISVITIQKRIFFYLLYRHQLKNEGNYFFYMFILKRLKGQKRTVQTSVPDPWDFGTDPDPDPGIHSQKLQTRLGSGSDLY